MTTETLNVTDASNPDQRTSGDMVLSGDSLRSEIERIARQIVKHLPRVSVNKLIDQLELKVASGKLVFDQTELQDGIEIASYIASNSNNEQAQSIAADLRELGKDYEKYQKAGLLTRVGLAWDLHLELQKLKKDLRGFTPWTLVKVIWGFFESIIAKIFLWATAKIFGFLLAVFLCFPKQQRMSHNNGIAARGTFTVVPNPKFPPSEFFLPNRVFPLRIRHASATFLDDAMNCIRSISVKLADTQFKSPFDLQMNTGATSLFWSATSFWKFAVLRKEKYGIEYRDFNRKYPEGLEASKIATRRHTAFERMYYYCKTPFLYNSSNGDKYYAKYRVVPFDKAPDAGIKTDRSDFDECNQRVKNHETRGRNFLKYEYEDLVKKEGKVRYWLQIQTRPASEAEDDPEFFNNMGRVGRRLGRRWRNGNYRDAGLAREYVNIVLGEPHAKGHGCDPSQVGV